MSLLNYNAKVGIIRISSKLNSKKITIYQLILDLHQRRCAIIVDFFLFSYIISPHFLIIYKVEQIDRRYPTSKADRARPKILRSKRKKDHLAATKPLKAGQATIDRRKNQNQLSCHICHPIIQSNPFTHSRVTRNVKSDSNLIIKKTRI